jgi:type I restriction enzyme M protein
MDLRRWGSPVEKKFIELTSDDREKVVQNYHNWQQEDYKTTYKDVPEFCYSASFDELKEKNFSLKKLEYHLRLHCNLQGN